MNAVISPQPRFSGLPQEKEACCSIHAAMFTLLDIYGVKYWRGKNASWLQVNRIAK